MKDVEKMMIFMFLGLIFAIFVLGYHKSPTVTRPVLGSTSTPTYPVTTTPKTNNPYEL